MQLNTYSTLVNVGKSLAGAAGVADVCTDGEACCFGAEAQAARKAEARINIKIGFSFMVLGFPENFAFIGFAFPCNTVDFTVQVIG